MRESLAKELEKALETVVTRRPQPIEIRSMAQGLAETIEEMIAREVAKRTGTIEEMIAREVAKRPTNPLDTLMPYALPLITVPVAP